VTSLERLGAEIAGAMVLCGLFIGWWQLHDHSEQKIGAQQCITATTEVKATAQAADTGIEAAQAAQLNEALKSYAKQKQLDDSANRALSVRVRDYALRAGAVCNTRPAAGPSGADRGLPTSQSAPVPGSHSIAADTQAVLDACDADHDKLTLVTKAYNDWRDRMIAMGKTGAP
jgi:hypothetical protein